MADDSARDPWQEHHLRQLGAYLKAHRAMSQLSQRELARLADVSYSYISHLENGRHEPSISVLRALADHLGIRPEELILYAAGLPVSGGRQSLEDGIRTDPRLSPAQREALLAQLERYLRENDASPGHREPSAGDEPDPAALARALGRARAGRAALAPGGLGRGAAARPWATRAPDPRIHGDGRRAADDGDLAGRRRVHAGPGRHRGQRGVRRRAARHAGRRLEALAQDAGERAAIIGHSRGGCLARALAVRRPQLVAGVIALGSPLLDVLACHPAVRRMGRRIAALGDGGMPGLMSSRCEDGACCERYRRDLQAPFPARVHFVSVHSRFDGVVDWHATLDDDAEQVEVMTTHNGMSAEGRTYAVIARSLGDCWPEGPWTS